ncbi:MULTISPECIES: large conductance mechanosensitive channel protein MscL [unclassified Meiothermus]|uniref:large conductance mechanosensitive channel protein MscL n=1 Tax=unclassified Meiothermus TaxID=370471 RepID=UPI000D7CDCA7|nr:MULTISPECIES: large conductance mechanosensitive channel protein MscL [unclassified Meiothermus]PZA06530.1 large conductance mechanosensitive channel protein MscL [Meiothermus sp. Pnk-1]RYM37206.1 large conductance mechanosensitive channel protein MscL [Meiothermus sp. PNK-Is4]
MLQGFRDFILRGNVVDLAVAVVIGTAFGVVVDSMVKDVITPIIGLVGGQPDFSNLRLFADAKGQGGIAYGSFLNAIISFLIKAAVVYFVIVVPMKHVMERLNRPQAPEAPAAPPEEIVLLREIRDALRAQPR